jgi:hypothetical protein
VVLDAYAALLRVVFGSYMPGAVWGIAVSATQRPSCHSYDTQSAPIALCGFTRSCSLPERRIWQLCAWGCLGIAVSATQRPSRHLYDTQKVLAAFCGSKRLCSLTVCRIRLLYAGGCLGIAVSDTQCPLSSL